MHHAQLAKRRSESATGLRGRVRGAQPFARRRATGNDAAGREPCADQAQEPFQGRALHPAIARRSPDAGGGPGLFEAARRARRRARGRRRDARLRTADVATAILRDDSASAGADDRGTAAGAARARGTAGGGRVQHALTPGRPGARHCAKAASMRPSIGCRPQGTGSASPSCSATGWSRWLATAIRH